MTIKTCPRCRRDLPTSAFAPDPHKGCGFKSWCRDCDNARCRDYYDQNRERKKSYYERRKAELPPAPPKLCKVCAEPTPSRRHIYCDACRPAQRATSERSRDRGRVRPDHAKRYGPAHQKARKRWARVVAEQMVACARCGGWILPGERWDLDHVDGGGPRDYLGPSHSRCNRATAGRQVPEPSRSASREW